MVSRDVSRYTKEVSRKKSALFFFEILTLAPKLGDFSSTYILVFKLARFALPPDSRDITQSQCHGQIDRLAVSNDNEAVTPPDLTTQCH